MPKNTHNRNHQNVCEDTLYFKGFWRIYVTKSEMVTLEFYILHCLKLTLKLIDPFLFASKALNT